MASMRLVAHKAIPLVILTCVISHITGCRESAEQVDRNWTPPVAIASSLGGLGGAIVLHKCQDTLIGIQVHRGSVQLRELKIEKNSWLELPVGEVSRGYPWYGAAFDPEARRVLLPQGYAENEQLILKVLMGTLTERGQLRDIMERTWMTEKKMLLGDTGPDVRMTSTGMREDVGLGLSIVNGSNIFVPYAFHATTFFGNSISNGPFANGVLHSSDSGKTWRLERVSAWEGWAPAIYRTEERMYYFATYPLRIWSSGKPAESDKWDDPTLVTKTLSIATLSSYDAAADGGMAHICWMDRRHDKWRFNPTGPRIENCDIYYRRRKDTDSEWSKEVHLSKGLLYCYAPTIAAEGDNVVVVWAGIRDAGKQHTDMGPNDIYYVTSRDGGNTWTYPLKITDGAKDGSVVGMPQLALLNGTIHLLYIQGSRGASTELSPGLTRLGNDPWPIYYTQRPFPK